MTDPTSPARAAHRERVQALRRAHGARQHRSRRSREGECAPSSAQRLREIDAAADRGRAGGGDRGQVLIDGEPVSLPDAQPGHRLPEVFAVSPPDGAGERAAGQGAGVSAMYRRRSAERRDEAMEMLRRRAHRRARGQVPARAVGRHAAARRDRADADQARRASC